MEDGHAAAELQTCLTEAAAISRSGEMGTPANAKENGTAPVLHAVPMWWSQGDLNPRRRDESPLS